MDTEIQLSSCHPLGEPISSVPAVVKPAVFVDTYGGVVHVEWDPQAAVTPLGQLPFFISFLKTADLFEPWVNECPLEYRSNNAPSKRDVLGTLFLSVLAGHTRYAHSDSVRYDTVNPGLLGMQKVVSSHSIRRAFLLSDEHLCSEWLVTHLRRSYEPLLYEPWILDVDTHIKVLYGHQEGAVLGYNPKKPGRPSHVLHTYFMANTRLVLDVEMRPGNESAAKYTMPGLWSFLDKLPRAAWPCFIRGDCAFGNERGMAEAEARNIPYLFKLRQTANVKKLIKQVFGRTDWTPAGQGWEGVEDLLKLQGWTRSRRVIVLRRAIKDSKDAHDSVKYPELGELQLELIETAEGRLVYEYAILVTSLDDEIPTIAQHYRDRGDAENNYDEQTNQWGWGGFTTQDIKRCQIMARIIALTYDWWTLFARLAIPDRHAEAITSRPLLLNGVAKQTCHAGQKTITITSSHAQTTKIQDVLTSLSAFLAEVKATAQQLTWLERWRMILSRIFVKFLRGRPLTTPEPYPTPG